jgi:ribosomal protein L35
MPKLKTHKALVKRIKISKRKKVLKRATGQNHYNSKDTGSEGRRKKKDTRLFKTDEKNVLKAMPYALK